MTAQVAYAEDAVLTGVMVNNDAFHEISDRITSDHFTSGFRRRVWGVLRELILSGEPADIVTVAELMPDDAEGVITLMAAPGSGNAVKGYANAVHDSWQRREASAIANKLLAGLRDGEEGAVESAIGSLLNLSGGKRECEFTGAQVMAMAMAEAQRAFDNGGRLPGITTGLKALNELLGGWHPSDLTIIGARPAMGKTAFMIGLAEAAAESGVTVGMFSAEQPGVQIGLRRLSLASGVPATTIRSGNIEEEQWPRMTTGVRAAKARNLRIYDRSALTLDELVAVARKWKHAHGIGALFIDYAQRITVPGADRITEVSTVARGLKNLARDLGVPVIALAQVVKGVDQRANKRPTAGDLANSDELTREADQVLMLYRDEVYARIEGREAKKGMVEVLVEKNRHGPTGYVELAFMADTMKFADLAPENEW